MLHRLTRVMITSVEQTDRKGYHVEDRTTVYVHARSTSKMKGKTAHKIL